MDKKDKLIEKLEEYIELLEKELGKSAMFLHIHGWRCKEEDIEKGEKLRKEIKEIKDET